MSTSYKKSESKKKSVKNVQAVSFTKYFKVTHVSGRGQI